MQMIDKTAGAAPASSASTEAGAHGDAESRGQKMRAMLRARFGEEVYSLWFRSLEFDSIQGKTVRFSVPTKFLCNWLQSHYSDALLACCRAEFSDAEYVEVRLRQPAAQAPRASLAELESGVRQPSCGAGATVNDGVARPLTGRPLPAPSLSRTQGAGFEGSPLDSRYTFASFVVGPSNQLAYAGATQVVETVLHANPAFNPFYVHAAVGLGKSHLLQAIAWEVKRRAPNAQVLYLTAERFRYQFVEALRSQDPLSFKEKFRAIHMLLIDDLEFMHGEKTEQEFDHIVNALLDGGRQVVVASARAPNHFDRLNERMRSRLQRGLVTEIKPLDFDLRVRILEKRASEKRANDPSFELPRDVIELLADRLTENGRELEGAVTRLYATWRHMRTPITREVVETVIRDLVHGLEPRRIKIEDILRIVSRHFGVSRGDLLSQRRHRSVVWPRQVGMYLAKQLTARSLPEIGRRFGNRDHTTVLHAIRKIEGQLAGNSQLRDELEELKKLLSH